MPDDVRHVLIDLAGVLYLGDEAVPGGVEALTRLRDAGLGVRFVTNTTRKTRADVVAKLRGLGYDVAEHEVFSALTAARRFVEQRRLRPMLLVHGDALPEFDGVDTAEPDAVVVGDAGDAFTYGALNAGFRVLLGGPDEQPRPLIATGRNRYFRQGDALSLDMGPFVAALEFASGVEARVVGKPAAPFFRDALQDLGATAERAAMIGDDLPNDIGGARAAGLAGVLVRTGKFRPADEHSDEARPDAIVDDFPAAVGWLLGRR